MSRIELEGVPSFSVHATCMSFMVGLNLCSAMIDAGTYKRILLVSAERGSVCRDMDHPESAALIGDGLIKIGKYFQRALVWLERPLVPGVARASRLARQSLPGAWRGRSGSTSAP